MAKDIRIFNNNGKIVGRDPETGEQVPIPIESVNITGSIEVDELDLSDDPANPTELVKYVGQDVTRISSTYHEIRITADDTVQTIISKDSLNASFEHGEIRVYGRSETDKSFSDFIKVAGFVIADVDENTAPDDSVPRSYSSTQENFQISIDDNGDEYVLAVVAEPVRIGSVNI